MVDMGWRRRRSSPSSSWLSVLPLMRDDMGAEAALSPRQERFPAHESFPEVSGLVYANWRLCHASEVFMAGLGRGPQGRDCWTATARIAVHAREIYLQSASPMRCRPAISPFSPTRTARSSGAGTARGRRRAVG